MSDVFISYSRKDKEFVRKLDQAFKQLNRDCWIDWEDIPPTADWMSEIKTGIEGSNTVVCVLSPDWITSKICAEELEYAIQCNKRLIPIVYREVPPDQTHPRVSSHNWLFFREADPFEEMFDKLIDALESDLDYIRDHTRLLVRAREWEKNNKNPSFMLRGDELATAQRWFIYSTDKKPEASKLHIDFIEASEKAEAERRAHDEAIARRVQNFGRATVVLGVVGTLALIAMIVSIFQARDAVFTAGEARTQVAFTGQTLTPIPSTLTPVQLTLQFGNAQVYIAQVRSTAVAQTFAPIPRTVQAGNTAVAQANTQVSIVERELTNIAPAQTQVARVGETLTPIAATVISGQQKVDIAQTQIGVVAQTLTPIAPTLTMLADEVLQQRRLAESLRWVTFANDILQQNGNAETATLLGVQALKTAYSIQADTALEQAMSRLYTLQEFTGFTQGINSLAYSPDGKTFITTGSTDSKKPFALELRNAQTGELIKQLPGHKETVFSVAFSADGKYILSGGGDLTMKLWDAALGVELRSYAVEAPKDASITAVAISGDNRYVLAGTSAGPIRVFEFKGTPIQVLGNRTQLFGNAVKSVVFSSDNRMVLEASADKSVRLWVISSGRILREFNGHIDAVNSAVFSRGGTYVLTGSRDTTVRLWDANTGTQIRVYPGHRNVVTSASFSPDGRTILSSSTDRTARIWDVASGELLRVYSGHNGAVTAAAFAPNNQQVLTGSNDNTIRLWAWSNVGNSPLRAYASTPGYVKTATLSPNARIIATHTLDGEVRLWNADTGVRLHTLTPRFSGTVTFIFSPDSSRVFVASASTDAGAWEVATGREIRDFNQSFRFQNLGAIDIAFTPDNKRLIINGNDNRARLWNMEKQFQIRVLNGTAHSVATSPDSKMFAVAGDRLRLYDAEAGNELRSFAFPYKAQHIKFMNDGKLLLVVEGSDVLPHLIDLQTGNDISTLTGRAGALRYSLDEQWQLIHNTGDVRTFDAVTGQPLRIIVGTFASAVFTPDSSEVMTVTYSGIVQRWKIDYHDLMVTACERVKYDLSPEERVTYSISLDDPPICFDS